MHIQNNITSRDVLRFSEKHFFIDYSAVNKNLFDKTAIKKFILMSLHILEVKLLNFNYENCELLTVIYRDTIQ